MNYSNASRTTLASLPFLSGTVTEYTTSSIATSRNNQEAFQLGLVKGQTDQTMPCHGGVPRAYHLPIIPAVHAILIKDQGGMIQLFSKLGIQVLQSQQNHVAHTLNPPNGTSEKVL